MAEKRKLKGLLGAAPTPYTLLEEHQVQMQPITDVTQGVTLNAPQGQAHLPSFAARRYPKWK